MKVASSALHLLVLIRASLVLTATGRRVCCRVVWGKSYFTSATLARKPRWGGYLRHGSPRGDDRLEGVQAAGPRAPYRGRPAPSGLCEAHGALSGCNPAHAQWVSKVRCFSPFPFITLGIPGFRFRAGARRPGPKDHYLLRQRCRATPPLGGPRGRGGQLSSADRSGVVAVDISQLGYDVLPYPFKRHF